MCIIYIKYIEWSIFNKENSTLPQSYLKNDNDMSVLVWKDFQDMLLTFENQAWSGAWETKKVSPTFAWANWFESFQALGTKMRTLSCGKWVFAESKLVRVHKTEYQSRKSSMRQHRNPAERLSQHAETTISTGQKKLYKETR